MKNKNKIKIKSKIGKKQKQDNLNAHTGFQFSNSGIFRKQWLVNLETTGRQAMKNTLSIQIPSTTHLRSKTCTTTHPPQKH